MAEPKLITFYTHPNAEVEVGADIGQGTKIWRHAHVRRGAVIGEGSIIGHGVFIDEGVRIGNFVKIQNYATLYAPARIEDGVFIGPHVVFTNDRYPRALNPDGTQKSKADWVPRSIVIREGASIGANVTLLSGIEIGAHALVGAGSVVTRDVAPGSLVVGNPARHVRFVGLDAEAEAAMRGAR